MPFPAYEIYRQYEEDKFKTSTEKKVAKALEGAKKESGETKESIEFQEAKEIFGKDFLGPEAIEKTFDIELTQEELESIKEIPFSREELEKAKELGMMLVLRVDHDKEGNPLTINRIRETFAKEDTLGDPKKKKSKMFYRKLGDGWYDKEDFATKATAKTGWGLSMKSVIPESLNKNWNEQEKILKQWAEKNGINPATIKRRTPIEAVYDTITYYGENQESLLEDKWDWTSVRSSGRRFVGVGDFGSGGLGVGSAAPDARGSLLGVCPSR